MAKSNGAPSPAETRISRRRLNIVLLLAFVVIVIYVAIPPSGIEYNLGYGITIRNHRDSAVDAAPAANTSGVKNILLFTTFFESKDWWLGDRMGSAMFKSVCPVSNCYITNNREYLKSLSDFDAILFHYRDMVLNPLNPGLPNQRLRKPGQRYVMFFVESPENYKYDYDRFSNFFNWTMTYRMDSDIQAPYGRVIPKSSGFSYMPKNNEAGTWDHVYDPANFAATLVTKPKKFHKLAQRPKAVAWIVSHCDTESDREGYVRELKNHIGVDIFGACGSGHCENCPTTVLKNYMFYLSFENSFCDQYVTEKLWRWLKKDIVPIVMGQQNYSDIVPPHSVINAIDFPEPKELASYLKQLMDNETEYLSYFWWKDFYEVSEDRSPSYCRLCQMLNDKNQPPQVRDHLNDWWSSKANCKSKGSFTWSKYR